MQRLLRISEDQWGLVTRRQVLDAHIPWRSVARLVERGLLDRVAYGVYRVRGGGESDHLQLRAAWLQLDSGKPAWARLDDPDAAVVSYASAAEMHDVGELRADVHEFTLPVRRQTRRSDLRLHRGQVPVEDRLLIGGLPVTRTARMIADLIADHADLGSVAQITAEVVDRGLDAPQAIAGHLAPYAARFGLHASDGQAFLEHLMDQAGRPMAESCGIRA